VNEDNIVQGYWILPKHSNYLMSRWDLIPQETCFWRRSLFERGGNIDRHSALRWTMICFAIYATRQICPS